MTVTKNSWKIHSFWKGLRAYLIICTREQTKVTDTVLIMRKITFKRMQKYWSISDNAWPQKAICITQQLGGVGYKTITSNFQQFVTTAQLRQTQHCKSIFQLKIWENLDMFCDIPISTAVFGNLMSKNHWIFGFYRPIKIPHYHWNKTFTITRQYDKTASLPVNGFTRLGWEVAWILRQARTRHVEIGSSSHSKHDRSNALSD